MKLLRLLALLLFSPCISLAQNQPEAPVVTDALIQRAERGEAEAKWQSGQFRIKVDESLILQEDDIGENEDTKKNNDRGESCAMPEHFLSGRLPCAKVLTLEMRETDVCRDLLCHIYHAAKEGVYFYDLKIGERIIDLSSNGCEFFLVLPYLKSAGTVTTQTYISLKTPCAYIKTENVYGKKIACINIFLNNSNLESIKYSFIQQLSNVSYDGIALRWWMHPQTSLMEFIKLYDFLKSQGYIMGICIDLKE